MKNILNLKNIVNRSGGLSYHLKALRYKNRLWQSYQSHVSKFLDQWQPPSEKLLLIGPSSGNSLSNSFLNRFNQVNVIEIDPIAIKLFKRRFEHFDFKFYQQDYFNFKTNNNFHSSFQVLDQQFSGHAVLFCNILGQISYLLQKKSMDTTFNNFKKNLKGYLKNKSWASYHDLYTINATSTNFSTTAGPPKTNISSHEFLLWLEQFIQTSHLEKLTVNNHLTSGTFDSYKNRFYFSWQIQPKETHIIEGIYNS